ncbi:hypothetical protein PVK06_034215 [Gossypium arboreum]|uniref:Uncharacterized protein n=1 Tax=Gossypium arboreum TaxID=29729 RepID=A0ABR0NE52_GOSAR|nr:hypothetical protein PVK06_034215 [Gossypium arboreum]
METRDTHIPFYTWRVYYHTRGRVVTARVTGGWTSSDWVSCRSRLERCMRATFKEGFRHDLWSQDRYELVEKKFWWNHRQSYVGLLKELQDIRLLLDQRLKAEFEWTSYSDPRIQKCISFKFLVNLSIEHVNMPLVVYATVEMHELDRVMWKFRFRQTISLAP